MRKVLISLALAAVALTGCETPVARAVSLPSNPELSQLTVTPSNSMSGYSRDKQFGGWADEDKDGCDTRAEILERDAIKGSEVRNSKGCVVGAQILDRYSGNIVTEQAGAGSDIDIDHIVPLGNVWISGGINLTAEQRRSIANDPMNLYAVSKSLNRAKGDSPADKWLPPKSQCEYVRSQVAVKAKYRLTVTQSEHDAMAAVLSNCN